MASDGLPARCVGQWSKDKAYYIRRYTDIFSRAMTRTFALEYVDLFAGPGRCVLNSDDSEFDGSPVSALRTQVAFSKYHFVESAPRVLDALRRRTVSETDRVSSVEFYDDDANVAVRAISERLSPSSLVLAVIDPTGLHFRFDSLRMLTRDRRVDIIYLFPDGMDVNRNLRRYMETSTLDEVLGTTTWRHQIASTLSEYPMLPDNSICPNARKIIIDVFKSQLETIGYEYAKAGDEIRFKNSKRVGLYYLVFGSKHSRGHEFWNKIQTVEAGGQKKLSF